MRFISVAAIAALALSLGACSQTTSTAAGAAAGAAAGVAVGSYFARPVYPETYPRPLPYQRTVVVERPTYARPLYQGPVVTRTYITTREY
jgi:hypothetical protein